VPRNRDPRNNLGADTIAFVSPLLRCSRPDHRVPAIPCWAALSLPSRPRRLRPAAAVRGLSFPIELGKSSALVGESGSGKIHYLARHHGLLPPSAIVTGDIIFPNSVQSGDSVAIHLTHPAFPSVAQLRGSRIAMIFQEPMTALNPVMRVGEQIAEAVLAHNRRLEIRSLAPSRRRHARRCYCRSRGARPQLSAPAFREACGSAS